MFMHALFEAKIGWDETVPEPLLARWHNLALELSETQPVTIPRCCLEGVDSEILSYQQSIPRLELLFAVLLARLMDLMKANLSSDLKILSCHCCTDSQVSLCWIHNVERSWKPFVQN